MTSAKAPKQVYESVSSYLGKLAEQHNMKIAAKMPLGRPAKSNSKVREFRLQLINTHQPLPKTAISQLISDILKNAEVKNVTFNELSPNSSKFPSISMEFDGYEFDFVIARGANKGENFEKKVVSDLDAAFKKASSDANYAKLIGMLIEANPEFAKNEIRSVKQRTGKTSKAGVAIENLGKIIGDIVITDTTGKEWFISLKDTNGATFSAYGGGPSLFNSSGDLQPNSEGAKFIKSFGVDLNKVQHGFDTRLNKNVLRASFDSPSANSSAIKAIFERAWGMNYFYVRKQSSGWKVFWIDRRKLDEMTGGIRVTEIRYPDKNSKQISIYCSNSYWKYKIEIRNSSGGTYPNDIKFQVL